jgi:hypothetical protein
VANVPKGVCHADLSGHFPRGQYRQTKMRMRIPKAGRRAKGSTGFQSDQAAATFCLGRRGKRETTAATSNLIYWALDYVSRWNNGPIRHRASETSPGAVESCGLDAHPATLLASRREPTDPPIDRSMQAGSAPMQLRA